MLEVVLCFHAAALSDSYNFKTAAYSKPDEKISFIFFNNIFLRQGFGWNQMEQFLIHDILNFYILIKISLYRFSFSKNEFIFFYFCSRNKNYSNVSNHEKMLPLKFLLDSIILLLHFIENFHSCVMNHTCNDNRKTIFQLI